MRGKFGVVVGMDGSGKSTLLASLKEKGFCVYSWRDLRGYEAVKHTVPDNPLEIKECLKPMSRATFVLSHLVAEYEYLVDPVIQRGEMVLLDSYYFRWLAKEHLYGKSDSLLLGLCKYLPRPDFILLLSLPAEIAYLRKETIGFNAAEYLNRQTLSDFVRFQNTVIDMCLELMRGLEVITIDATQDIRAVESEVIAHLRQVSYQGA